MEDEGWKLLLLCRLSPLIPYNILNITMASTKIHFWPFAIVSFLGQPSLSAHIPVTLLVSMLISLPSCTCDVSATLYGSKMIC